MQDHIAGSPVIAEANTPLYRWGNRISIYTGLPAIIGWDWHQKQQRAAVSGEVVDWRLQDLNDLYNNPDVAGAQRILERYHVGYIYVGELEQAYYSPEGLAKFEQMVGSMLEVVYQRGPVTIYRVIGSGAREISRGQGVQRRRPAGLLDWLARHWVLAALCAPRGQRSVPSGGLVRRGRRVGSLMLDRPVDELPVLRDRGLEPPGRELHTAGDPGLVAGAAAGGLGGLAHAARVCPGTLPIVAMAWPRRLGLLLVSYLVWIGASLRLVANSPPAAWAAC